VFGRALMIFLSLSTGASSASDGLDEVTPTPAKKKLAAFSFAKYKRAMTDVCTGLNADGRQQKFFEMLDNHDVKDPDCLACKPLINAFAGTCRAPKPVKAMVKKKDKEVQATPEETASPQQTGSAKSLKSEQEQNPKTVFLQREPNVAVIQGLSQIFGSLAEDEETIDEYAKAVDRVVNILRDKSGKTLAEIDYFDFMSQYIRAPFTEYFEKRAPKGHQQGGSSPKIAPTQSVNSLFE
jgi:hypothetical protein